MKTKIILSLIILFMSFPLWAQDIPYNRNIDMKSHDIKNVHNLHVDSLYATNAVVSITDTSGTVDSLRTEVLVLQDSTNLLRTLTLAQRDSITALRNAISSANSTIASQLTMINALKTSDSTGIQKVYYYIAGPANLIWQPDFTGVIDSMKLETVDSAMTVRITKSQYFGTGQSTILNSDVALSYQGHSTVTNFASNAMTKNYFYKASIISSSGVTDEELIITIYWRKT